MKSKPCPASAHQPVPRSFTRNSIAVRGRQYACEFDSKLSACFPFSAGAHWAKSLLPPARPYDRGLVPPGVVSGEHGSEGRVVAARTEIGMESLRHRRRGIVADPGRTPWRLPAQRTSHAVHRAAPRKRWPTIQRVSPTASVGSVRSRLPEPRHYQPTWRLCELRYDRPRRYPGRRSLFHRGRVSVHPIQFARPARSLSRLDQCCQAARSHRGRYEQDDRFATTGFSFCQLIAIVPAVLPRLSCSSSGVTASLCAEGVCGHGKRTGCVISRVGQYVFCGARRHRRVPFMATYSALDSRDIGRFRVHLRAWSAHYLLH